jgi:hypothetical protein
MSSLLADEHIWPSICNFLGQLGHDLHTVRQFCTDKAGDSLSDEVVLQLAIERGMAVITKNADDFIALHKATPWHTGIVVCRFDNKELPQKIARRIDDAIREVGDLRGKLLTVSTETTSQLRRRKANRRKK